MKEKAWKDAVDAYKRDPKWQAGLYVDDPLHNGEPTFFEIWEPEVYTGYTLVRRAIKTMSTCWSASTGRLKNGLMGTSVYLLSGTSRPSIG